MINANAHIGAQKQDANTGANAAWETGTQLRERLRVKERAFQGMWKRTLGYSFNANKICTPEEIAAMEGKYIGKKMKRVGRKAASNVVPPTAVERENKEPETGMIQPKNRFKKALLWGCLSLSLGCSVPNMLSIMEAIKGDEVHAIILTAAFTIAPFLLIGYGVSGALHMVVYVVIGVEVFCNAAGFYGGMTGLSHSLYTAPTMFLHMVTSMTNSGNEGTALLLALCMAICIALLAIAPVYELRK